MSRLLTTGQMIDVIRIGEIGRTMDDENDIKRTEDGLFWINEDGELEEEFSITDLVFDYKWEITPEYVSFDEAYEAFKDGQEIVLHLDDGSTRYFNNIGLGSKAYVNFEVLLNGKYTINYYEN